jgi:hypothetical protein
MVNFFQFIVFISVVVCACKTLEFSVYPFFFSFVLFAFKCIEIQLKYAVNCNTSLSCSNVLHVPVPQNCHLVHLLPEFKNVSTLQRVILLLVRSH